MNLLDELPQISFVEKNTSIIVSQIINKFEQVTGRTLYPGDPLRLILLAFSDIITQLKNDIDFSAKQNLLKFVTNDFIDYIGSLLDVDRLKPSHATTVLTFSIPEPQNSAITIPKNTKVSDTDGNIIFETINDVQINPGQTSVSIKAICATAGTKGNGFYPSQINHIISPLGYVCNVSNISISSGGEDIEDVERFRQRIQTAPEGFSVAGPDGAYEFWAKTANQLIFDVSVKSPSPGCVEIIPLLKNGEMPTQDILDSIYDICNDTTKRPLTDKLTVRAPEIVNYNLNIIYYIARSNVSIGISIQENVNLAINEYILWQRSKLGRDLNPSELTKKVVAAGAKRVEISSPTFIKLEYYQIAVVNTTNTIYGGIEDD